jgi:hypothetical protein
MMRVRSDLWRQFPVKWAFWWVVVPNLMAIVMWPIGGPSMASSIFVSGFIAYLCSQHPNKAVRIAAIVGILVLNVTAYIALSFNLRFYNLVSAMKLALELDPFKSPEYLIAGTIALIALVLAIRYAPRTGRLASREQRLLAVAALALLINVDTVATAGTRGSYKASAPAGTPIDSAVLQNHIAPDGVTARNLVVIIVESMGQPAAAEDKRLFDAMWNPARWSSRYDVGEGSSLYYGSTTNAELREWCGVWADHESFDFDHSHCLPETFREAGFRTVAIHSFQGSFFDRQDWYPKIGFGERMFSDKLEARGAHPCGGVFPGVCDRDVPHIIGDVLRASRSRRNLIYWLTVNAHLPVAENAPLKTRDCRMGSLEWREEYPALCRNLTIHRQVADAVTAEIMRPDFPEADILIVGDHMPPFFPRDIRSRFDAARVPWIYLRNRAAEQRAQARRQLAGRAGEGSSKGA